MNLRKAMWWLAGTWFVGAGLCFVVLVGQSQVGLYDSDTAAVWGWFLPTVMPTLSLIVGSLVADYRKVRVRASERAKSEAGPVFWLGVALSAFYLLLLGTTIAMASIQVEAAPLGLMQRSNLWLGPLQGLCVAALGFFFQSKS
jgi:hypothetical protein